MRFDSLFPLFLVTALATGACTAGPRSNVHADLPESEPVAAMVPFSDEEPGSTVPEVEPRATALELSERDVVNAINELASGRPKTVHMSSEQQAISSNASVTTTLIQADDGNGNMYQVADSTELFNEMSATMVGWSIERNRQIAELPEDEQPFEDWTPVSIAVASNGATPLHAKTVDGQSWIRYDALAEYHRGQSELFAKYYQPEVFIENPNYIADTYQAVGFDTTALTPLYELWLPIDLSLNREFPQVGSESIIQHVVQFVEESETTLGPAEFEDGITTLNLYFGEPDEVESDLAYGRTVPHLKLSFDNRGNISEIVEALHYRSRRYQISWEADVSLFQAPSKALLMTPDRLAAALEIEISCVKQFDFEWLNPADIFQLCSQPDPEDGTAQHKSERIGAEIGGTTVPEN